MSDLPFHKAIIIGDRGVGKSFLKYRFLADTFGHPKGYRRIPAYYHPHFTKLFDLKGKELSLQIWDLNLQERYRSLSTGHFRKAVGVLLVYDITKKESFENLAKWLYEANEYCEPDVSIVLVGNKCDMENSRVVSYKEGRKFAEKYGLVFYETSCKTGDSVKEVRKYTKGTLFIEKRLFGKWQN